MPRRRSPHPRAASRLRRDATCAARRVGRRAATPATPRAPARVLEPPQLRVDLQYSRNARSEYITARSRSRLVSDRTETNRPTGALQVPSDPEDANSPTRTRHRTQIFQNNFRNAKLAISLSLIDVESLACRLKHIPVAPPTRISAPGGVNAPV